MTCRLLYLVGQLGPGGLERQLYYLLSTLDRQRYAPAVAVWNYRDEEHFTQRISALAVPCYAIAPHASGPVKLTAFRHLVMKLQPEVVHSYSFHTNIAAHWATRGSRIVPIGSLRSELSLAMKDCGWWLGNISARWPRTLICNSHAAFLTIRNVRTLFIHRRVAVIRNALDVGRFCHIPLVTTDTVRIVGIGSLLPIKRWDRLLVAAQELKRQGLNFSVRLIGSGPLRDALQRQIHELGISDCVEMTGHSDNIPQQLAEATLLAHTSDSEGCPNSIMEAMACGRAVVATDTGDVSSLVEEGKTGFVVPRTDTSLLCTRLAALIANQDLCRSMGVRGRAKAERAFGLDRLVTETLATYQAAGWKGI